MSFFLTRTPASATCKLIRPAEQSQSQSGGINRRFSGFVYWQGSFDPVPHGRASTDYRAMLADVEKASGSNGSFFADLYPKHGVLPLPTWITVVAGSVDHPNTATSFAVPANSDSTPHGAGGIASFRRVVPGSASQQAAGRLYVTARVVVDRIADGSNYAFKLEDPLPQEFVANEGAVIEVCLNRPHIRARMTADSLAWTTSVGKTQPMTVEWFEDVSGNMTFLHDVLRSPTGGTNPPPLNRFLITEDGSSYISTEDGRPLITEH